jgi:L-methionine (R)-S-oxide reductase
MFSAECIDIEDKAEFYRQLKMQVEALLDNESDYVANAANVSALIFQMVPELNWAGFYFLKSESELVLGPFQGKAACVRIAVGKGVCGTAIAQESTILVADVHAFPGHIACDAASRSELVIPLFKNGKIFGVLDLDSPVTNRFTVDDQNGFQELASIYSQVSDIDFQDRS